MSYKKRSYTIYWQSYEFSKSHFYGYRICGGWYLWGDTVIDCLRRRGNCVFLKSFSIILYQLNKKKYINELYINLSSLFLEK